ncbi:MAG: glucosamine-6-phosphate deaminase [Thermomicrobiales bacterium]
MTDTSPTITVLTDPAAVASAAADIVASTVAAKPDAVIALPTGSTPLPLFRELHARIERGDLDLSRVRLFCLDEYVGATPDDPNSLIGWLQTAFIDRSGIHEENIIRVPAAAVDPDAAALNYERALRDVGGLDLAVLGLGPNGHIAYNEPGSAADSRTRTLDLTPQSIAQAEAYWKPGVATPHRAITMGVATLLESRRILLIVTGAAKAGMLRRSLEEPMTADVPASWLRLAGARTEVIADVPAATGLARG